MTAIKIACVSDIHLSNRSNSTKDIIANLVKAFPDNEETSELDILFLAGDVFDGLVNLPDQNVIEIDLWFCSVLRTCKKYNILLRILDGTKSHDWYQSARFVELNTITKINADVKYIKDLSIEHIDKFDLDVLYVPDEWSPNTEDTKEQVKALLNVKGLTQVDLSIMHGQFPHQLPVHVKKVPIHDPGFYLDITRYYVFIGHVHTHSCFDRIIAQGSFDRLTHGQEEPKGHVRAEIELDTEEKQWFFVENVGAKIYKTIKISDKLTLEESLDKIRKDLKKVPDFSAVRIHANKGHPILDNKNELNKLAPLMTWSTLVKDVSTEAIVVEEDVIENSITISRDNILDLLLTRLNKSCVSPEVFKKSEELLKEII